MKRYGVPYTFQLQSVINKSKKTIFNRYGKEFGFGIEEYRKKSMITRLSNWKSNKINTNDDIIDIDLKYKKIIYICNNGHTCFINYQTYKNRKNGNTILCTECNPINKNISGLEIQLLKFIKENYNGEIISNIKKIINPYELDIYLPELNLAFEFNGLYWHNEQNKPYDYHKMKSDMCDDKGIQLIHIWEDDWLYKNNIIKSYILNKLDKNENKLNYENCIIKEVNDNNLVKEFLNNNHINGNISSSINIGLFYKDELVSLITFIKSREPLKSNNKYELLRFCNKINTNIKDSLYKLFNYFLNTYNPIKIKLNIDRSYDNYILYQKLGFKFKCIKKPNYNYIIDGIRNNKNNFKKSILIKEGYDENKTEHEIMLERKIYRIYDSGNYELIFIK